MAGTGKTTFLGQLKKYVTENAIKSYFVNLDPAVLKLPFTPNIDIRNSVNYKELMSQYNLGPNGAIMTSLNFFSTRFDQVMNLIEKRGPELDYVFVDTPGQIEVFNWSASGTIITDSLASAFPTVFVYVVDTPRCSNPNTFMSNMLYACSIFYKTRLPMMIAFNKVDIVGHDFCLEWMSDSEAFDEAVRTVGTYMSDLTRSMGLFLREFYKDLPTVGVSARTSLGMAQFFEKTLEATAAYESEYKPELIKRINTKKEKQALSQTENFQKIEKDMKDTGGVVKTKKGTK